MNYIFLANGFEEIEAISVIDILRRAKIDLTIVSINETLEVTSDRGLKVLGDIIIKDVDISILNSVILPGGSGYKNLQDSEDMIKLLHFSNDNNKYIFAICAAPSILGDLGFLKNKTATCFPSFEVYLEGYKPCSTDVCRDGNIITSKGPGTAHNFAYEIVSILKDSILSDTIRQQMLF